MEEPQTQSVQFDVNLPRPGPRGILGRVLIGVGVIAIVGVMAVFVLSRTAATVADPTLPVMPLNTIMYVSLTTQPDKQPNYGVIADAWSDSKEARQLNSVLQVGLAQLGLNWESDIQPWLGERLAFGLVDLGGATEAKAYRGPGFVLAVHTSDPAKAAEFLTTFRRQKAAEIKPSDFVTTTLGDETYRGIPMVYLTTEFSYSDKGPTDQLAYAPVNDLIVLTNSREELKQAIDAALDGTNLTKSEAFNQTMSALPAQTVMALYMDYPRFMTAYLQMVTGISSTFDEIYSDVLTAPGATPSPEILKMQEEARLRREDQQRRQQKQLEQMQGLMQAMGGMGLAMTYDSTGIRFDSVAQYDVNRLPEQWRALYSASLQPASGKVFETLPANTLVALNAGNFGTVLKQLLDPASLEMMFGSLPGMDKGEVEKALATFQTQTGLDLNADVLNLFNGEFAFTLMPLLQERSDTPAALSAPFEVALLFDSSDAARLSASFDKIFTAIGAEGQAGIKVQPLSGLPYSAVLDEDGNVMFVYGIVDGRLVFGSTSNTLLGIQSAKDAPLSNDATFKAATDGLPANRLQTMYLSFPPLVQWIQSLSGGKCTGCEYLSHFKWLASGSQAPVNGLQRSVARIAVGK
jgi:hypothetical protein